MQNKNRRCINQFVFDSTFDDAKNRVKSDYFSLLLTVAQMNEVGLRIQQLNT